MKEKRDSTKVLFIIIAISAILFGILGIAMIIIDQVYIKGIQYILTAVIYSIALKKIRNGQLILDNKKNKNAMNFNLGFIFSVIGITSPLGSPMFTMWILGIILFLLGMFYTAKEPKATKEKKKEE